MHPFHQLLTGAQSYWMDNLTRHPILPGTLEKQVQEHGLRGVTTNPAIIHKAVTGSDAYAYRLPSWSKQAVTAMRSMNGWR
jgi:transaldolase